MRNYTMRLSVLVVAVVVTLFTSCSTEDSVGSVPAPNPNIAQIIAQDPKFSILNAAVNRAGLASALAGPNITLFAPDNDAFIDAGIRDVSTVPVPTLQSILTYHVVNRRIPSGSLPYDTIRTVNLQNLYASRNINDRFINGFGFRSVDRLGSNGVIHTMKNVLFPPGPNKSIASVLANDSTFSMLYRAVLKLNYLALLNDPNKLTMFAPNNAAFRVMGINDVDAVPVAVLDQVVRGHIVKRNVAASDLQNNAIYETFSTAYNVKASTTPSAGVSFDTSTRPASQIIVTNNICTNGIIHVINRVMLP